MTLNRSLKRTLLSLLGLMALFAPTAALAQFGYELTNGTITITSYPDWTGGAVTIPSTIEGVPVTTIGQGSFSENTWLTSVMIPNSVTTIGDSAFEGCSSLTNITIAGGVIVIEDGAFGDCSDLTSIAIPNSVTSIGYSAFSDCWSLTNVTVGSGLTTLGGWAFYGCTELAGVFFTGNAPGAPAGGTTMDMFTYDNNATVYYLPGTTGWARHSTVFRPRCGTCRRRTLRGQAHRPSHTARPWGQTSWTRLPARPARSRTARQQARCLARGRTCCPSCSARPRRRATAA